MSKQLFNNPEGNRGATPVNLSMATVYRIVKARIENMCVNATSIDPDAVCQNVCVELEKAMGVFPNVNGAGHGSLRPVIQEWVQRLSFMQQSVLLSAMRNADGVAKRHPSKDLVRWFRRCVVVSAFDGRALQTADEPGGGSYTGPVYDLPKAVDAFIDARDEMTLHYFAHFAHAAEIIGYKHPVSEIRDFWHEVYVRMVHALHMWPETVEQMNNRLGDDPAGWMARNDPSSTCSD